MRWHKIYSDQSLQALRDTLAKKQKQEDRKNRKMLRQQRKKLQKLQKSRKSQGTQQNSQSQSASVLEDHYFFERQKEADAKFDKLFLDSKRRGTQEARYFFYQDKYKKRHQFKLDPKDKEPEESFKKFLQQIISKPNRELLSSTWDQRILASACNIIRFSLEKQTSSLIEKSCGATAYKPEAGIVKVNIYEDEAKNGQLCISVEISKIVIIKFADKQEVFVEIPGTVSILFEAKKEKNKEGMFMTRMAVSNELLQHLIENPGEMIVDTSGKKARLKPEYQKMIAPKRKGQIADDSSFDDESTNQTSDSEVSIDEETDTHKKAPTYLITQVEQIKKVFDQAISELSELHNENKTHKMVNNLLTYLQEQKQNLEQVNLTDSNSVFIVNKITTRTKIELKKRINQKENKSFLQRYPKVLEILETLVKALENILNVMNKWTSSKISHNKQANKKNTSTGLRLDLRFLSLRNTDKKIEIIRNRFNDVKPVRTKKLKVSESETSEDPSDSDQVSHEKISPANRNDELTPRSRYRQKTPYGAWRHRDKEGHGKEKRLLEQKQMEEEIRKQAEDILPSPRSSSDQKVKRNYGLSPRSRYHQKTPYGVWRRRDKEERLLEQKQQMEEQIRKQAEDILPSPRSSSDKQPQNQLTRSLSYENKKTKKEVDALSRAKTVSLLPRFNWFRESYHYKQQSNNQQSSVNKGLK